MTLVSKIVKHFLLSEILFQIPSERSRMCSFCLASTFFKTIQIIYFGAREWDYVTNSKAQIKAQEHWTGSPGSYQINCMVVELHNVGHRQKCHNWSGYHCSARNWWSWVQGDAVNLYYAKGQTGSATMIQPIRRNSWNCIDSFPLSVPSVCCCLHNDI